LVSIPAIAAEVSDEWLEAVKAHIESLQKQVDLLTVEVNESDRRLDYYRQKYESQKGFYAGGAATYSFFNATYPIGVSGIAMYKFDRWGIYTTGGYANGLFVGLGGIVKIGR
jgi:hypothetical protein